MKVEHLNQDRFWVKVEKTDGCWLWTAYRNPQGYGMVNTRTRIPVLAHRASFFIATGIDPGDQCVCHKCDNPPCVNPDHLFLGSLADNNADMLAKGRASGGSFPGEMAPWSKLTEDDVRIIRSEYAFHGGGRKAAKRFGVTTSTISCIQRGKTWTHIQ